MSNVSPAMKRLLAGGGLLIAVAIVLALGLGASGRGGGTYEVRAIFDTASFIVPGEDVKVAGVKVGAVQSLDVTRDNKAVIVLRIDDPAFQDFKQDASCTIRLQSLIGEKFVACQPTQPRDANAPVPPDLHQIERGDGKGQYLLPVSNTSSPVDIDLLNTIMRMPERQRFSIIINELGVGLAGNGAQLRSVIRRADPALQQFDRVLAILASQNKVLAKLAVDSDTALAPVAAQSASISDFVDKAGATATATASRGDALEANFQRLPEFLRQLTPTAQRLGELAAEGLPVMTDLRAAAPSVNTIAEQLGPFSTAALPALRTLGNAADVGSKALVQAQPVINDVGGFAKEARPFASTLAAALTNLQGQFGIQRLLQVVLYTLGTTNGFDNLGHYLRSYLYPAGSCLAYSVKQVSGCESTFNQGGAGLANVASASQSPPVSTTPTASVTNGSVQTATQSAPVTTGSGSPVSNGGAQAGLLGYLLGDGSTR
jgi:phospholipid/cholesterol/gamma-HCH transport system substrate-binding protein